MHNSEKFTKMSSGVARESTVWAQTAPEEIQEVPMSAKGGPKRDFPDLVRVVKTATRRMSR